VAVSRIVAFHWSAGWVQIPVQVDERDVIDFDALYNDPNLFVGTTTLGYTDPNTYAGPDSVAGFDADDELVLMAADAGSRAPGAGPLPPGIASPGGLEVEIFDTLDGGSGWVYLFEADGSLDPNADADYGTYSFNLLAGSYIPNYNVSSGPNPENSTFASDLYQTHFADRWIRDRLNLLAGGASGADILDRHKNMFAPGNCGRTEDTFSAGEGAFFANKDGAVRSIRSYVGANSGPLTQRDHLFYRGRQDIVTHLRVHAIPGVVDLYDYAPVDPEDEMTYFNDLNPGGVPVDGDPDAVTLGTLQWEMVTGAQGTATIVHEHETDTGLVPTSYYSDDATPSVTQCTGDAFEYATSGPRFDAQIPNTDPLLGSPHLFVSKRVVYYDPPGAGASLAQLRSAHATTPLLLTVSPFSGTPAPAVGAWGLLTIGLGLLALGLAEIPRRSRTR
jgi:hypothetical protein